MTKQQFISTYWQHAVACQTAYGLPLAVILAQAGLESGWGASVYQNNFFGIKANSAWKGKKQLLRTHEMLPKSSGYSFPEVISITPTSTGKYDWYVRDYFRAYDTAEEGFMDYGAFITGNSRYNNAVINYKNTGNWQAYCRDIAAAGYATATNYANSLISTTEQVINYLPLDWQQVKANSAKKKTSLVVQNF
ncbi:MAG: glucosaminidase domain-containing protein [Prevotellaceae bacterium]|jgi:flagellar protein FlgJ|nr:glucosaminidase domain-containing protein [Prevotellaceae bacterium]